ncbi:MAG: amidophosphoribosyltransferase [Nanoarchaeota archaeon]
MPIYLEGEPEAELKPPFKEECGIAGVFNLEKASVYCFEILSLLEHRGEKSVGIVSEDSDNLYYRRRMGKVHEQFVNFNFDKLPGKIASGHNRYATSGDSIFLDVEGSSSDVQPLIVHRSRYGPFALSHNGTLVNTNSLEKKLIEGGATFQSSTDSELISKVIGKQDKNTLEDALIETAKEIPAAYSLMLQAPGKLIALRDKYGVRPLSIGRIGDGYVVSSESYALEQFPECHDIQDIKAGELCLFSDGLQRIQYTEPDNHFCIFEGIYFSNPRSMHNNSYHEDFRKDLGKKLYQENDIEADVIIPVLDSGKFAAVGMYEASGIPYEEAFLRIQNPPRSNNRSFTSSTIEKRERAVQKKLNLRKDKVYNKNVVVVDDTIVRSSTMNIINKRLKEAGAKSITTAITAPPVENTCPYGIDIQTREELIAANKSIDEIRQQIGSKNLYYLSLEGLNEVSDNHYRIGKCTGCFGGKYASF